MNELPAMEFDVLPEQTMFITGKINQAYCLQIRNEQTARHDIQFGKSALEMPLCDENGGIPQAATARRFSTARTELRKKGGRWAVWGS